MSLIERKSFHFLPCSSQVIPGSGREVMREAGDQTRVPGVKGKRNGTSPESTVVQGCCGPHTGSSRGDVQSGIFILCNF